MRKIDLIASFELEINKIDNIGEKPNTDDSLYWLNQAIVKFAKDRFNGNAPKRTSYEQNEKRTRDLIKLCKEIIINNHASGGGQQLDVSDDTWTFGDEFPIILGNTGTQLDDMTSSDDAFVSNTSHNSYNSYEYLYPKDLMFVLNEDVVISDMSNNHLKDTSVFECTADNFMYRINNSLTDFHYKFHNARPLRIRTKDGFRLLTDKHYKIHKYTLGYIAIPKVLTNEDPYEQCTDFPEYIWPEIVKIAALMYIENKGDKRYQTLTNEVLTQE